MRLTIEVVEIPDAPVVAIVLQDGERIVIGASGDDARLASQAALTAFWKHQDAVAQAQSATSVSIDPEVEAPRATTWSAVRRLLKSAVASSGRVRIVYVDGAGHCSERVIRPSHVGDVLVTSFDEQSDDVRTFRIDRIESAQVVV